MLLFRYDFLGVSNKNSFVSSRSNNMILLCSFFVLLRFFFSCYDEKIIVPSILTFFEVNQS